MMQLVGDIFRWIGGAVVPMVVRPTNPVPLAWFVHIILLIGISFGLYYAQPYLGISDNVGYGGRFRPYWLVALFLLLYPLVWAACWLFQLLKPNQPASSYPDIDEAWAEICAALEKSGIGISDTPVILVLGEHPAGFEPLFRSLPNGLVVAGGSSPSSPIRAYANRDAIYVTLSGATLLGVQDASILLTPAESDAGSQGSVFQSIGVNQSIGIGASVGASISASIGGGGGGTLMEIQKIIRQAKTENRPLTEAERARVRDLSGSNTPGAASPSPSKTNSTESVLQNPQIVGAAAERLVHFCSLLNASRWPLCPVNGVILAVPASATDRDDHAQQWGLVARQDLAVLDYGLRLKFPVYALVGGFENLPGGSLFFDRFSVDKANQRLGKGFPINPELRLEDYPNAVESNVSWVFNGLLTYWSFKLARVDGKDTDRDSRDNSQLVRFLAELKKRGGNLSRLLSRALTPYDYLPEFAGCYLSVVLPNDPDRAKFAREFFKKLDSTQGCVSWTADAFAEDAGFRSKTRLGYLAMFATVLLVVAFAVYVIYAKMLTK